MASEDKIAHVRSLCDNGRWPDVLAFALKWRIEKPGAAKAWFYQGAAQAAMGQFTEAEASYRQAAKLDAADFKTWNNLAALLFDGLKQPAEGAKCLAHALKLDPENKLAWANLASMNGQLGRHVQARTCAERALELDPKMVEAQLHRARAALMLGQTEIVEAVCESLAATPVEEFKRTR